MKWIFYEYMNMIYCLSSQIFIYIDLYLYSSTQVQGLHYFLSRWSGPQSHIQYVLGLGLSKNNTVTDSALIIENLKDPLKILPLKAEFLSVLQQRKVEQTFVIDDIEPRALKTELQSLKTTQSDLEKNYAHLANITQMAKRSGQK